jgi:methionyl-tRNA formyltransferase
MLRIGMFGLPLAALLLLRDGHAVRWCVLSPVNTPGRRRLRAALPSHRVVDLLDDAVGHERHVDTLLDESPVDLIVSWYFTRRIAERWLIRPRLGAIGAHPSLLPRHRGPNPFFWAIDRGDEVTGVTVHQLESEYDSGSILAQQTLTIGSRNAWQLARALDRPSLRTLREVVGDFAQGRPRAAVPQKSEDATWAPEPTGGLLRVDWSWPTERIVRRVRALAPVPGLALEFNQVRFFVTEAEPAADFPSALLPGEAYLGSRLLLRTGDGALAVKRAQMAPSDADATGGLPDDECPGGGEVSGETLARQLSRAARVAID